MGAAWAHELLHFVHRQVAAQHGGGAVAELLFEHGVAAESGGPHGVVVQSDVGLGHLLAFKRCRFIFAKTPAK